MTDLLLIAVAAATVNNLVLLRLLGLAPVLDPDSSLKEVRRQGLAITGVLTVTAALCHLLDERVLTPYGLPYLRILGFLGITLVTIELFNLMLHRTGNPLPMASTSATVLGVALLTTGSAATVGGALALGLGTGVGFGLVMLIFSGLRSRLDRAPVPAALRGPAIALVTLGMMSLAFLGFSGLGA